MAFKKFGLFEKKIPIKKIIKIAWIRFAVISTNFAVISTNAVQMHFSRP